MIPFVHLHVHTDHSFLDGAASIKALVDKARALGMPALAITDHGNMFGVAAFEEECAGNADHPLKEGVVPLKPVIGCEFYMAPESRFVKKSAEHNNKYYHLILLAKNVEGYRHLVELSSLSYTEGFYYKPRIDWEVLTKFKEGLICLSACVAGEIPSLILEGKKAAAEKRAIAFRDLFGYDENGEPNFYIELQDHRLQVQKDSNPALIDIAKRNNIPLVVTNDTHYLEREDSVVHDVLLCIGTKKLRSDTNRMRFETDEFYFKTAEEMAALFPGVPEAVTNTVKIARRCDVTIPRPGPLLPEFEIPAGFADAGTYLAHLTMEGLRKRYGGNPTEEMVKRAEYELGTIIQMNFTGYFLIVQDFIGWAKDHGVSVGPGRGSGAGSVVAYALRITDIDPFKYNLLFERFLNPERVSMPDFDIDFGDGREKVIDYVTQKYGRERVGQIVTIGTLKAKAVVKDVARVLGVSIEDSEMITKLIPARVPNPKKPDDTVETTLPLAFLNEPRLRELEKDPKYTEMFALARKLEGKKRQSGIHAAGVVIGKTRLIDYVPVFRDKNNAIAVQYDKNQIEPFGLVKMDFLGLKTLDVVHNCELLVRRRGGEYAHFDIDKIPEDDEATFKMFCEGNTLGLFQFESDGMRNILKQAQPGSIADLIALNALYRPGPMANIPQFVAGKRDANKIKYPHPDLEGILKETYGVFVYQEQVMQAAQIIAGYSLGGADILRRAMGKKKAAEMEKQKAIFLKGAADREIDAATAEKIFNILIPFAGYGFNKSHAAAYSVLAYQTGYLKTNFPVEFEAAALTNVMNDPEKLSVQIEETRKLGIPIEPPDINRSIGTFSVSDGKIVYGFLGIKGIGEGPAELIITEREKNGKFTSLIDFLQRCDFQKSGRKTVIVLIDAGAFDKLDPRRGTLAGNLHGVVNWVMGDRVARNAGQAGLFDMVTEEDRADTYHMTEYPEPDYMEKLNREKALLGFYISGHPLDDYKDAWQKRVTLDLSNLDTAPDGEYTLIGILKQVKPFVTKTGKKMAFGQLADYRGEIDLVFFERLWAEVAGNINVDGKIAVKGKLDHSRNRVSFCVDKMLDIDRLAKKAAKPRGGPGGASLEPIITGKLSGPPSGGVGVPSPEGGASPSSLPAKPKESPSGGYRDAEPTENRWKVAEPTGSPYGTIEPKEGPAGTGVLHIRLYKAAATNAEQLSSLRTLLSRQEGTCSVYLHVPLDQGEKVIRPSAAMTARSDTEYLARLKNDVAVDDVWLAAG
jgi:DNA polymerase-3 subunit alpha